MFRSVDWTHDMIIVKWHLFIWHERKLCALTNAPPVQPTQSGLALWAIHICSKLQATTILAGITIHWALRKIFLKIFCVSVLPLMVYVLHSGQFTLRSDKCATGSIHANGSMTSTLFHANCSKLQATTILAGITIHWALRKIFLKIFCVSNDDKCYGENMNWTENYKKFESDSGNEE